MKKNILFSMSAILFFSACTKDRPEQFPFRQGEDLKKISSYDGLECELKTEGKIGEVASHTADKTEIEVKDKNSYRQFDLVEYTTNCPVFSEIPFRGAENSTYTIKYALDEKYLKVYRVAKKEMIPQDEVAISEKNGDLYRTALLAYPLDGYFIVENNKNEFGDESNLLRETKVGSKKKGSHFKITASNFEVLNSVRQNIFSKDLFDGEWFYASTVVAADNDNKELVGRDLSLDTTMSEVSRIAFKKYRNRVRAVNLNIDPNADTKDDLNFSTAIEIPVEWVTYDQERNGNAKSLKQKEVSEKPWEQRDFAKVDFSATTSSVLKSVASSKSESKAVLEKLTIADGYFSFTVNHINAGIKVRYSFRKAHKAVTGKIYHSDDQKRFGFFRTVRNFISGYRYNTREDLQKMMFLNRFYPKNNEIKFYFSTDTHPRWYTVGVRSVEAWSEAFAKSGSPIKFSVAGKEVDGKFVPEKLVDVGDIRYNILNLVDIQNESNLLGYGPSIVDSESGEIISATANIYVNSYRGITVSTLRKYIMAEIGLLDNKYIFATGEQGASSVTNILGLYNAQKVISSLPQNSVNTKGMEILNTELDRIAKTLKMNRTELIGNIESNKMSKLNSLKTANLNAHGALNGSCDSFSFSNKNIIKEIEKNCPAVTEYIDRLKTDRANNSSIAKLDDEVSILESCANTLLEDKIQETLVHELGHNIGLRHNFYGNVDKANFYSKDEYSIDGEQVEVSSTMEYMPGSQLELRIPGKYDIAAIKFGYNDSVDTTDGKTVKLDTKKSIVQNLGGNASSLKKYMFCTDEHVELSDPLCQRHDFGSTATAIVENMIEEYDARNATSRFRNNQLNVSLGLPSYNLVRTYQPLGMIYNKWRTLLADHLVKLGAKDSGHLEALDDEKTYKMVLATVKGDPILSDYQQASDLIFNFLTKVAFTSDHYCLVRESVERMDVNGKKSNSEIDRLLNFDKVQKQVYKESQKTVLSCADETAKSFLASKGMTFVEEGGVDLQEKLNTLDDKDLADLFTGANVLYYPYEATGFASDRLYSYLFLGYRYNSNISKIIFNSTLSPNLMDEPHYRTKMLDILSTRMLQGESKSILADKSQANQDFYMRYSGPEKDLLSTFYSLTLSSLQVPGNVIASGNRMGLLSVIRTNDPDRVADMDTVVNYMGNYVGANAGNSFSNALLSEYNRIEALKKLSQSVSSVYKFTEEDKTKILLSFNLKTAQEVQAMNGKDYFEYVKKSLNEGFKKMSETNSELQAENVSYMLTSLIQKTVRTVNAESFKADAPVKGQIAEDSIFSSEKLYDLLGEYAKSAEKINDILTIYRENEDQFTSKQDMILKTFFN